MTQVKQTLKLVKVNLTLHDISYLQTRVQSVVIHSEGHGFRLQSRDVLGLSFMPHSALSTWRAESHVMHDTMRC